MFCVNSSSLKIPPSDSNTAGKKSRSSANEKVTRLSRNRGDKAKARVGNQDPPTRHTAANSDTLHDTPAQRAVQVSGCSASREWRVVGEEWGQRSENPVVVKAAVCPEHIDCDHMNSSVSGGVWGAEAAGKSFRESSLQEDGLTGRRQMCRAAAGPEPRIHAEQSTEATRLPMFAQTN